MEYFKLDGIEGDYFHCANGMGMLSKDACAQAYKVAMSPKGYREGLRIACRNCPLGAYHAGAPAAPTVSRFFGSCVCSRCGVASSRRLIRGSLCISCYNREREVLKGKNAKGTTPVFLRQVHPVLLNYKAGTTFKVVRFDLVVDVVEAVVSVLRNESEPVVFGWVGKGVIRGV